MGGVSVGSLLLLHCKETHPKKNDNQLEPSEKPRDEAIESHDGRHQSSYNYTLHHLQEPGGGSGGAWRNGACVGEVSLSAGKKVRICVVAIGKKSGVCVSAEW